MNIVFIGAGNLATGLSLEMQRVGMTISQVYSRTSESAETLAKRLGCAWTTSPEEVLPDADLYIFSVKDAVLPDLIRQIKPNNGLWVHTAGSVPIDVFEGHVQRYGVLYPLQTFSKDRRISLEGVPVFLELNNPEDEKTLKKVAKVLTKEVHGLSSEKRKSLHLAAVFACNFTNHMYALAAKVLEKQDIPYDVLLPLINETAAKIREIPPAEAQTGPAVRYDKNIIDKQMAMLEDPAMRTIYQLLSQNIYSSLCSQ
ncbi:MAG: DUF2520 domain-containing protein [Tannerellaceae bacterium]|nr:DUF2520 domain-containing protein [Tannerellaceae bacterium]